MGIDQKRPLAGFALVAVLCAVLMTLSVSRGWGLDLFHPGRPIVSAAPSEAAPHDRGREAPATTDPTPVSVPAELSTQPLGVASGAVAQGTGAQARPVRATGTSVSTAVTVAGDERVEDDAEPEIDPDGDQVLTKTDREATKAARQAEREASKAARQAEREAAKAARQAEREAAKAARQAEREAAKAARQAEREAAKAARQAEREAAKAARQAEREAAQAQRLAEREAARAAREAEHAAAQATHEAEHAAAQAAREAERAAADVARDAAKAARHP